MSHITLAARRSMLVLILAAAATMSACSNPTAPTSRTSTVEARHSGYLVASSRGDSTEAGR